MPKAGPSSLDSRNQESDRDKNELAIKYITAAISDNTRAAYQSDASHFLAQGYALPADPDSIQRYLLEAADQLNPRTLSRRLIAIGQWHRLQGMMDPTKSPKVAKTMAGISRLHGIPKKQASAISLSDLKKMVRFLDQQTGARSARDKAIILLGFFGAFRRSELAALHWDQVHFVNEGLIIKLLRSKTDQTGEGGDCVIPTGKEPLCPARALIDWRVKWRPHKMGDASRDGASYST